MNDAELIREAIENLGNEGATLADFPDALPALKRLVGARDEALGERSYTIFHEDGPISLTETELCNEYMRLRGKEA